MLCCCANTNLNLVMANYNVLAFLSRVRKLVRKKRRLLAKTIPSAEHHSSVSHLATPMNEPTMSSDFSVIITGNARHVKELSTINLLFIISNAHMLVDFTCYYLISALGLGLR